MNKERLIKMVELNLDVVKDMLSDEENISKFTKDRYFSYNRKNSELRQRMKMLRKDLLLLEKAMIKEEHQC